AERLYASGRFGDVRRESLKKLHSDEVEDFIKRDGFGVERIPRPSPRYLELAQAPTFPLARVSYPDSALEGYPRAALPAAGRGVVADQRLPSLEGLINLNYLSNYSFLEPGSLGYARKPREAAGFDAHKFRFEPTIQHVRVLNHDLDKEAAKE